MAEGTRSDRGAARGAPHGETVVAPLAAEAEAPAAALLARAFRDNPLNVAVIGGDPARRLRANLASMRALLPTARRHGLVLCARREGRLAGVLVALPPFAYPLPPPTLAERARTVWQQGLQVSRRWTRVFEALRRLHPPVPHWYLGTLGVDPPQQRGGVGAALVAAFCARADRDGLAAYLEADRAAALPLYRRARFETISEECVEGVPVWRMQRDRG